MAFQTHQRDNERVHAGDTLDQQVHVSLAAPSSKVNVNAEDELLATSIHGIPVLPRVTANTSGTDPRIKLPTLSPDASKLVQSWKRNFDSMLVFAGLFSAVDSAFIIQASGLLRPDYSAISTKLTLIQTQLSLIALDSEGRNISLSRFYSVLDDPALDVSRKFTPPISARVINCLWLASLVLSLWVALSAIIIRRRLEKYENGELVDSEMYHLHIGCRNQQAGDSPDSSGAQARLLKFSWNLALVLHCSLFLFFGGLYSWLFDLDLCTFGVILPVSSLAILDYTWLHRHHCRRFIKKVTDGVWSDMSEADRLTG
ncbi:hypothetical protein BKA62DRAFT_774626 [Auriculariales sp. MPI-PUGE-AT-0066]|nr:hypothetical protein BKA62DRAFT_774626 [Auriculariales sp. MPI-PUGE-AT-0066]